MTRCAAWSFACWEGSLSFPSFSVTPEQHPFSVNTNTFMDQAQVFFSSISWSHDHRCDPREKCRGTLVGDIGDKGGGCLGHLFMQLTYAGPWAKLDVLLLPDDGWLLALPDLTTWWITVPSAWWEVLASWSLDGPVTGQELFFLSVYSSLLKMVWLCSRTLGVFSVTPLLGFVKHSTWHHRYF